MPKRVVLVDSGRGWRGGQQQVFFLARELQARGHSVYVVAPPQSPLATKVGVLGLGSTTLRGRHDLDFFSAFRLARIARDFKPDVIHCHDSRSHAIAQLAAFFFQAPGALVITRRSTNIPSSGPKYSRVDRFMAVSQAVVDSLMKAGVPADRIDLVYSGIEQPQKRPHFPSQPEIAANPPGYRVVTVAALEKEKGLDVLIETAAHLALAGESIVWTVVGTGSQAQNLERLQQKSQAPVKFVGWHEDIAPFLENADLMVHPARSEALGTVILEALSRGVPVVASRVGGIPEIVSDKVGGLARPGQPEELGAKVLACLENKSLRKSVLEEGPRLTREYTVEQMVDGVLGCYDKCVVHGRDN